jgi:dTMP kinase
MPLYVLDGIDGCGKSTQAKRLAERLRAAGQTVHLLREPGGTVLGESVRALLLDRATEACPEAEVFGYQMARAQLCRAVIAPALARGETLVLDRFWYSTIAYQAHGLGLDEAAVRAVIRLAIGPVTVAAALWLDLDVAAAAARRAASRGADDRIEARGLDYLRRVHAGFAAMAAAGELTRIDASGDSDAVTARVIAAIEV